MKIRSMAMLCILAMLLAGCGAASAPETTAAPTEPSFFEEQGFQMWEGFTVEADPEVRELHGTATIPNAAELFFYKKEGDVATEILHKEFVEADVDIHIAAYYPGEFGMERICDVVDCFYQRAVEDGTAMTKEEWLAAHEDYVIYNCWMMEKTYWGAHQAAYYTAEETSEEDGNTIQIRGLVLMDGTTGAVLDSGDDTSGIVGSLPLTLGGEEKELLAVYDFPDYLMNSEISSYDDWGVLQDMFVMVPKAYNGLTFLYEGYAEFEGTDEEILADLNGEEEEASGWKQLSYSEYKEENDFVATYFFTPAELDEQDTRHAPAVSTFLDKMGIAENMEKFTVTENMPDSGVKETHWNNSISVPGAEVLYFNVGSEQLTAKNYVWKGIANCRMDVYAREYPAEQFNSQEIQKIINTFYEADKENKTKQQWLHEHQEYKLVHFSSTEDFWVSGLTSTCFTETKYKGTLWSSIQTKWNTLIDKYTGEMFRPQSGSEGVVETFRLGDITFSVINTMESEWYKPVSRYNNYRQIYNMYVLVPAEYNGLTYTLIMWEQNRTDEQILAELEESESIEPAEETEEETCTWWRGEFYEEDPHLKRYYFIPAN